MGGWICCSRWVDGFVAVSVNGWVGLCGWVFQRQFVGVAVGVFVVALIRLLG